MQVGVAALWQLEIISFSNYLNFDFFKLIFWLKELNKCFW